jgi:hypothetical protein
MTRRKVSSIEGSCLMLRVFIEFLDVESARHHGKLALVQRTRNTKTRDQTRARDTDVMLDCFELPLATPNDFDPHQGFAGTSPRRSIQVDCPLYPSDRPSLQCRRRFPSSARTCAIDTPTPVFRSFAGSTQDPCRLPSNTKSNHRL